MEYGWYLAMAVMVEDEGYDEPSITMTATNSSRTTRLPKSCQEGRFHYRTKYPMSDLAIADAYQLQESWLMERVVHCYAPVCVSMRRTN